MRIITATAVDDPSLPFDGPRGFSAAQLAGLYFMDGSDTLTSIRNYSTAVGAQSTGVATPGNAGAHSSAVLMTGGGIQLRGTKYLPGPQIDYSTEWTLFSHMAVGLPTQHDSVTSWTSPIVSSDGLADGKASIVYATRTSGQGYPSSAAPLAPALRRFESGAQQAATAITAPTSLCYTTYFTIFQSLKAGNLRARFYVGGSKIADTTVAINVTNMVNGTPLQKPCVGTPYIAYNEANLLVECYGVWTRELSDADCETMDLASVTIRQSRGR
ncbi:hypothetical protein [Inquilinus limosus]|uniref:Uncharacterized protein n=1 Tax=Inquilinus limosus MP06 TaxID=1398085 RepID=A0A0A0DBM5_9PROT|nr:hypothetical protein [Inquilinus limosus]KGM36121.1 hypothetical protein P409_00290 [Inquilinus limosus MP06]